MRVVVTGLVATYPLGGVAWDYLAYVDGLRRLGCEVLYLEDTGGWFYDPVRETFRPEASAGAAFLAASLAALDAGAVPWAVRDAGGTLLGMSEDALAAFCRGADLLLNVSGAGWLRDAYRAVRRTAYVDTDPGYTQALLERATGDGVSDESARAAALIRAHDRFFTFAERITAADCGVPACGLPWAPTRQPLVLDRWPAAPAARGAPYRTLLSWRSGAPPELRGVRYGGKEPELRRCLDLPRHLPALTFELAVSGAAPRAALRAHGWRVIEARAVSADMDAYRAYLHGARGEWSVAKDVYVALRSGWFSGRSAAFLASGRPVVVQDTGWSACYPTGAGLFAFTTLAEAIAALEAIEEDYARHAAAARALAARAFDHVTVLPRLLDAALAP